MSSLLLLLTSLTAADTLRTTAESAAGRPVALDPRIGIPACPEDFQLAPAGSSGVRATCPSTGWSLLLPFAGPTASRPAPPLVRRGDPVQVRTQGPGFEVRMEGVAETAGASGGRVRVKLPQGTRLVADVGADGRLTLAGRP